MFTKSKAALEKLWDVENQFTALIGSATGKREVSGTPKAKLSRPEVTLSNKILENVERIRNSIRQGTAYWARRPAGTVVQESAFVEHVIETAMSSISAEDLSELATRADRHRINDVLRRTAEEYIEKGQKPELDFLLSGGADWIMCDRFGLSRKEMANIRHGLLGMPEIIVADVVAGTPRSRGRPRKALHAAKVGR